MIATGGTNPNSSNGCGAGIGAGLSSHANVTITNGMVTAIGGSSEGRNTGGAGIGGSGGMGNATVKISGGTVTAKGGDDENGGAGIGGSGSDNVDVTITGGMVTATGGSNVSSDDSGVPGAGIGLNGSGKGNATFSTESGNAFIIATGGAGAAANGDGITGGDNTSGWSGIIFNGDEGQVYGSQTLTTNAEIPAGKNLTIPSSATLTVNSTLTNEGTLTIDGGTLNVTGTLGGSGSFFTTELTEEMITVPTGLFYDGNDRTGYIGEHTTLATKTYCNKEFQVTGWTQSVTKVSDLEYTVTYAPDSSIGGTAITKTVTLAQSGTNITATSDKKDYNYGDTVTINATVTPSGEAPTKASARLRGAPTPGQMALYLGDTQVSDPVNVGEPMTVTVKELIAAGAKYGPVTLTVKFAGNDYTATAEFADANAGENKDVTVTVTLKNTTVAKNYVLPTDTFATNGTINKDTSTTAPGEGEGYTIDYTAETITVKGGYEVSTAENDGTPISSGKISDYFGKELKIRKKGDSNHAESEWTTFTPTARPILAELGKADETLKGKKDGTLPGVTSNMEYRLNTDTEWTAGNGSAGAGVIQTHHSQ